MLKRGVKWQLLFTLVFTGTYILSTKNQLGHLKKSYYQPNFVSTAKSIFSPAVKSKTKNKSSSLPVCFDLGLTSFLVICIRRKLRRSILSKIYESARSDAKGEGTHRFGIIQHPEWACKCLISKIVYWKKSAFWMIRPLWNVLLSWI